MYGQSLRKSTCRFACVKQGRRCKRYRTWGSVPTNSSHQVLQSTCGAQVENRNRLPKSSKRFITECSCGSKTRKNGGEPAAFPQAFFCSSFLVHFCVVFLSFFYAQNAFLGSKNPFSRGICLFTVAVFLFLASLSAKITTFEAGLRKTSFFSVAALPSLGPGSSQDPLKKH